MECHTAQRCAGYRSCAQKSDRGGSTPAGCRSVANQNRPAPCRRVVINQLVKFEGNRKENAPKEKHPAKTVWNARRSARCLTCSELTRERRLRNSSALYPIDSGILPVVTALEAEGDIMAIGAPECGGIAGPAAFDDDRAACP